MLKITPSIERKICVDAGLKPVKWSVISVNFNSLDYLDYQARVLQEFNEDYEYIICDNTFPRQEDQLNELKLKYKNIKIIINPIEKWKHGSGLNSGLEIATGKYVCMIDPDFFFHKKNYLGFLEEFLQKGYHAVGTEFIPNYDIFPMPWGAAYFLNEVKDLNMDNDFFECKECNKWVCKVELDTGYQIRIRLKNKPFVAFKQVTPNIPFLGYHSVSFQPKSYEYDGEIVCSHLMRGIYHIKETIDDKLHEARKNYCEYFYSILR